MQKILIVEPCDSFRSELKKELQKNYCISHCAGAEEAMGLLATLHPAGLFLNLRLEGMDGLHFLEEMQDYLPPVIITMAPSYSPQAEQKLLDLGVTYPLRSGCPVRAAARHMDNFLRRSDLLVPVTAQQTISTHLRILGVPRQGGFDDLRVGTPLFAQDPAMSMTKEFYPAVAALRGRDNWQQVEKAIRAAKETAYANRNDAVWQQYFPDTSHCPKNKDFIARLAEFVS